MGNSSGVFRYGVTTSDRDPPTDVSSHRRCSVNYRSINLSAGFIWKERPELLPTEQRERKSLNIREAFRREEQKKIKTIKCPHKDAGINHRAQADDISMVLYVALQASISSVSNCRARQGPLR